MILMSAHTYVCTRVLAIQHYMYSIGTTCISVLFQKLGLPAVTHLETVLLLPHSVESECSNAGGRGRGGVVGKLDLVAWLHTPALGLLSAVCMLLLMSVLLTPQNL